MPTKKVIKSLIFGFLSDLIVFSLLSFGWATIAKFGWVDKTSDFYPDFFSNFKSVLIIHVSSVNILSMLFFLCGCCGCFEEDLVEVFFNLFSNGIIFSSALTLLIFLAFFSPHHVLSGLFLFSWLVLMMMGAVSGLFAVYRLSKELIKSFFSLFPVVSRQLINAYRRSWNYLIQKINNLTLTQTERAIKISQNIKYFGILLATLAGILAFKSNDEFYSQASGSISVVSTTTALTSEIVKERLLEPQLKRLESYELRRLLGTRNTEAASSTSNLLSAVV
jgi:hypothetical protein